MKTLLTIITLCTVLSACNTAKQVGSAAMMVGGVDPYTARAAMEGVDMAANTAQAISQGQSVVQATARPAKRLLNLGVSVLSSALCSSTSIGGAACGAVIQASRAVAGETINAVKKLGSSNAVQPQVQPQVQNSPQAQPTAPTIYVDANGVALNPQPTAQQVQQYYVTPQYINPQ